MILDIPQGERSTRLTAAGLSGVHCNNYLAALESCLNRLSSTPALDAEARLIADACRQGNALLATLPIKSQRNAEQKRAAEVLQHPCWNLCVKFFRRHAREIYARLTADGARSPRVDVLLSDASRLLPGILPSDEALAEELKLAQKDKDGLEIVQGLFISAVLSCRDAGSHLVRSMLRPTAQALALREEFIKTGQADLGTVRVQVEGGTAHVTLHNERYLNSDDDTTVGPLEVAFDLALMHPDVRMGVLRGSVVDHPKYKGRRIFCSGINLTRIYQGRQSYVSFLYRNMSMHAKVYRGIIHDNEPDSLDVPLDEPENTLEKLWLAVVDTFAIGGGCQLLLVADYVIAESGSWFSLPARKEGFVPGVANMRLPRFVGERAAKQAVLFDKRFEADSAEGRMIANEVVPSAEIDAAIARVINAGVDSGLVSASSNKKTMRIQTEPFDRFRQYLATYAREQAFCSLSEQLIDNLERHWNAKERKL